MAVPVPGQYVCLLAPRLLTVSPMGAQVGTSVEVTVAHQNSDGIRELSSSNPKMSAKPVLGADGTVVPNRFRVTVAPDATVGVYDARLLTNLGVSAARAFAVGSLPEINRSQENNSLQPARALPLTLVCNATTSKRVVDYYSFQGSEGPRVTVDCDAPKIDSKLNLVVTIADPSGDDLLVNRTSGVLDFTPPADGTYLVKIHDLTFQDGPEYFYRVALRQVEGDGPVPRQETTAKVSAFSWPPVGLGRSAQGGETEPNGEPLQAQKITLPCDLSGSFASASDLDLFEFQGKKGRSGGWRWPLSAWESPRIRRF